MAAQIIPLTTTPNQTFTVAVNIDGTLKSLMLTFRYNSIAGYWVMTIQDAGSLDYIVDSVPLVVGQYPTGNILGQYAYLNIGSAYIWNINNSADDSPDDTNLGTDFVLLWYDTPAA
jgi:hypothetical protein